MARTPTTHDVFNAIAEPKRRVAIELLMDQDLTVNALAEKAGWAQPMASKHLAVLKEVGLVTEHREGRCRIYTLNAVALSPIRDWLQQFAAYWNNNLDQLDRYLTRIQTNDSQE